MYRTFRYRIKDSNSRAKLAKMASAVNYVWNYCNETSSYAIYRDYRFLSGFDLNNLTAGSSKELGISSTTIQEICSEYATRRKQFKKRKLRWRSYKRNLGWIPFKASAVRVIAGEARYHGVKLKFWNSREFPIGSKIKTGSFCQDSRNRWYVNLVLEIPETANNNAGLPAVGIDLGLKTLATLSDGTKVEAPRIFRRHEQALGMAQRARKKRRAKTIHAKIVNSRKDFLHKETTKLANKYKGFYVGNVSSKKLSRTKLAKSVSDASWANFKTLLEYKAIGLGKVFAEIDEKFSSVTCSVCTNRTGPSGLSALGVREWVCNSCGVIHDRDVNAANNILRLGHETLIKGILGL